jgi:hypothetical protein
MRKWPDVLPTPSYPGFSLSPVEQSLRTDMEVGAQRVRRITRARNDKFELVWTMTDTEFCAWRAWWADDAWSLAGDSDSLAGWTLVGITRVADAALSPDLALVDRLTEDTATSGHYTQRNLASVTAGGTVLIRATLKPGGRDNARISYTGWDNVQAYQDINLTTAALGASSGVLSSEVESRGDGWVRVTMTAAAGTGATTPSMRLQSLNASLASTYTGDGASTLSICEVGARMVTGYDLHLRTDSDGNALGAAGGSAWVEMPVAVGGGMVTAEARFTGMFKAQALAGLNWQITAQAEVRNA